MASLTSPRQELPTQPRTSHGDIIIAPWGAHGPGATPPAAQETTGGTVPALSSCAVHLQHHLSCKEVSHGAKDNLESLSSAKEMHSPLPISIGAATVGSAVQKREKDPPLLTNDDITINDTLPALLNPATARQQQTRDDVSNALLALLGPAPSTRQRTNDDISIGEVLLSLLSQACARPLETHRDDEGLVLSLIWILQN